jgi:hypothetical protein
LVIVTVNALSNPVVHDPAFRNSRSYAKDWSARELWKGLLNARLANVLAKATPVVRTVWGVGMCMVAVNIGFRMLIIIKKIGADANVKQVESLVNP